ncbi:MAG: hypothetical protein DWG76_00650 [Chloroflexi bacterium]|nr:hypothetical protein [Chloroflexota bacterium]
MPSRIRAKPKIPMPIFRNMLSRKISGSSIPVTGIRTPGTGVAVGVGVGPASSQDTPALLPLTVLKVLSPGSYHMIATLFGRAPSTGVWKPVMLAAGTLIGPPVALPPTTHQTKLISKPFTLLTCQRSTPV